MKNVAIIILTICILLTIESLAQNDTINQVDKEGRKFGYWKTYYENNKLKEEGEYKKIPESASPEQLFMMGITKDKSGKTNSIKIGKWNYYSKKGMIIKKEMLIDGRLLWYDEFVYEKGQFVEKIRHEEIDNFWVNSYPLNINPLRYRLLGRTYESQTQYLGIISISEEDIPIDIKSSSPKIKFLEKYEKIMAKSELKIPFSITFEPGDKDEKIELKYFYRDTICKVIEINYIGYDISTVEFRQDVAKIKIIEIIKNNLCFYRSLDECELKIYPFNNKNDFDKIKNYEKKELKVIPLSLEFNEIDINFLDKGKYLFRVVNYRDNIDLFAIINRI